MFRSVDTARQLGGTVAWIDVDAEGGDGEKGSSLHTAFHLLCFSCCHAFGDEHFAAFPCCVDGFT